MFYDDIADYYDLMIPFDQRVGALENQLRDTVAKYGIKTALDAGSASGATCVALAGLGVWPCGIELSRRMVVLARKNCREHRLRIPFKTGDLSDKRPEFRGKFEAVFCLANTISHFLNRKSLDRVLANFQSWLIPGGILMIQLLNYARIFRERERIVKIYNNGNKIFIRFYDFEKERLNFNLLTVENTPGLCRHSLYSVSLRGWKDREIAAALKAHKFAPVKMQADFKGTPFKPAQSNDLVIICRSAR